MNSDKQISVNIHHSDGLKFQADVDGRKIELNSSKAMEQAFTPMELFLVSFAGCTAMDVQWIMHRQRQKVDKFDMTIVGVRRDEDPRSYESIEIRYALAGANLRKDAVERAVRLSQEKYCSVRAMIKDSIKLAITYTITTQAQKETSYTYG